MRIFISHTQRDARFAARLAEALAADGDVEVWNDNQILPGDNWALQVARALERADALVALISPEAMASEFVKSQWEYALGQKRFRGRLIPVEIRPTPAKPWILDKLVVLTASDPVEAAKQIKARLLSPPRAARERVPRPEAFLSHASGDRRFVDRLAKVLETGGVNYFYSGRHIAGAKQWHDELGAALRRCDWFVLVLSPNAVSSVWVKRELLFALQEKHYRDRIAPVVLKSCEIDKLSWTLSSFEHIDFRRRFDAGCRELLAAMKPPRTRILRGTSKGRRR